MRMRIILPPRLMESHASNHFYHWVFWLNDFFYFFFLLQFPAEPESTRKERLYQAALRFFDEGEAWERGIALAEELRAHYQRTYQVQRRL